MFLSSPSRVLSTLLLATAVAAQAAPAPEPWRVLRAMEIEGLAAFSRDDVAAALVVDEPTKRELLRGLDAEAAAFVAERVQELHRRGGYWQAVARGEVTDGVLQVALTAGPRQRCGAIRVVGDDTFPVAKLRERLASDEVGKAGWSEGDWPRLGPSLQRRIVAAVRDVGRLGVACDVAFESAGEQLDLVVTVREPGRDVRIQRLDVVGEDPMQRDAVVAAAAVAPGTLATTAMLADLRLRLLATGRFLDAEAVLPSPLPEVFDPLVVKVTPRPGAPALEAVSAADVAQLRAAIDKVVSNVRDGSPLRFHLANTEAVDVLGLRVMPGRNTVVFAREAMLIDCERIAVEDAEPVRASFRVRGDEVLLRWGGRVARWRFADSPGFQFQVQSKFVADGSAAVRWGAGFSTGGESAFVVDLHPGLAVYMLTRSLPMRREGEMLVFGEGEAEACRVAADGSLVGGTISLPLDDSGARATINLPAGAERSAALLFGDELALQESPAAATPFAVLAALFGIASRADDARISALLRGIDAALQAVPGAAPGSKRQRMPSLVDAFPVQSLASFGRELTLLGARRNWSGWPVELGVTAGALLSGDTHAANNSLRAFAADERNGPVALASAAWLCDALGWAAQAERLRELAASRWSWAAVRGDCAALAENVAHLLPDAAAVGANWRAQPELADLFADLPPGRDGDEAAFERGCAHLWSAGGEAWLRRLLLDD